jgi:hypothetical protein
VLRNKVEEDIFDAKSSSVQDMQNLGYDDGDCGGRISWGHSAFVMERSVGQRRLEKYLEQWARI